MAHKMLVKLTVEEVRRYTRNLTAATTTTTALFFAVQILQLLVEKQYGTIRKIFSLDVFSIRVTLVN